MTKFDIILRETEVYYFEGIEAGTEEEVLDIAYKLLDADAESYHNDSEGESTVYEVI